MRRFITSIGNIRKHNKSLLIRNYVSDHMASHYIPNKKHKLYEIVTQKDKQSLFKKLLDNNINPNSKGGLRELSLIELAANNGCAQNVELLLKAGVNPKKTYSDHTLLDAINLKISYHYWGFIGYNEDIDENTIDDLKRTRSILLNATDYTPHLIEEAVKFSDWDWVNEIVNTKKIVLDDYLLKLAFHRLSMTKSLLKAGLNPNYNGLLPLHAHSYFNNGVSELDNCIDILKEYIKYGANLNIVDKYGQTALMVAASTEHPLNDCDYYGGYIEAVKLLLDAGCDKHIVCTTNGMTALDYVLYTRNLNSKEYTFDDPLKDTRREALKRYEQIVYLLE